MKTLPSYRDVVNAAKRLDGHALKTAFIRSDKVDELTGKTVWFKPECNQKVGAFKYRGAFNRLSAMAVNERDQGVVAYSSGNHAQGVSRAAKELGISAIIVMPEDAPKVKVAGVIADGAEIVFYNRDTESREAIGTVGLEIAQSDITFDALITCMGGGGLCAGISLAMTELSPDTKIYGAEPEHYNDHQRSFLSGQREHLKNPPPTLCDALMTPQPGALTWPINQNSLSGVFSVSDEACLKALEIICVILSGGNVDQDIMAMALEKF